MESRVVGSRQSYVDAAPYAVFNGATINCSLTEAILAVCPKSPISCSGRRLASLVSEMVVSMKVTASLHVKDVVGLGLEVGSLVCPTTGRVAGRGVSRTICFRMATSLLTKTD